MPDAPAPVAAIQEVPPSYRLPAEDLMARARASLADEPRCDPSTADAIVVCARVEDEERLRLLTPAVPPVPATQRIGEALNFKIGPVEVGSIDAGDGTRAVGVRIKF
jgi:hypothetical protein